MPQRLRVKMTRTEIMEHSTWTCCFGLHVRTATVLIGLWHLFLNFSILVLLAVLLRHPEMIGPDADPDVNYHLDGDAPALPTPLSKVESQFAYRDNSKLSYQNIDMGVMACLCMMAITMFMITGALKGKASHLLPFFCVQLFDFAVTTLTATGYICYLRNIHRLVAESSNMPWRDSILQLSPNALATLVLFSFVGTIMLKAYVIGIVWRCYKYLTFRMHDEQLMLPYVIPDVGMAGSAAGGGRPARDYNTLLPGYEEALAQSMKQQPPPSYQAAMSTAAAAATAEHGGETATGVTVVLPPVPVTEQVPVAVPTAAAAAAAAAVASDEPAATATTTAAAPATPRNA